MMKNTLLGFAAILAASCTPALKVEVANPTQLDRDDETVEIAWSEVSALQGVTPENVVVLNDDKEQVPSQVLYRGEAEPQALIFQTDADANETKHFQIVTGTREAYPAEAFGRQVPERYDDYAWENNKVAYRLYGPALETSPEKLVTPGIDVWVKCTEKLQLRYGPHARQRPDPHDRRADLRPVRRKRHAGVAREDHLARCQPALQPHGQPLRG